YVQSGSTLRRPPCGAPVLAYSIASSTRSVSVAGSGPESFAAAARSRVSATVLRAMPSERAIARSVAPPSFLRRRISLPRRIDTLSAGIGSPAHRSPRRAKGRSSPHRSSDSTTLRGWPTSNRNGRDQIGIGGRLDSGISGRLAPESAVNGDAFREEPQV